MIHMMSMLFSVTSFRNRAVHGSISHGLRIHKGKFSIVCRIPSSRTCWFPNRLLYQCFSYSSGHTLFVIKLFKLIDHVCTIRVNTSTRKTQYPIIVITKLMNGQNSIICTFRVYIYDIYLFYCNSGETILPLHTCRRNLANDFSAFFYNKILTIRSELGLPGLYKCGSMTTSFSGTPLSTFMDATEIEIRNIIKLSTAKSCELDPLPTWLLKECIAELVPTITDIVNMSLRDSLMPKSLKTALIRPHLEKTGLDSDILKNYRPVSNLTFMYKYNLMAD